MLPPRRYNPSPSRAKYEKHWLYWVPLRAGAGFLDAVSESESQMDLSGFFALGAGGFLAADGAASEGFLAAGRHKEERVKSLIPLGLNPPKAISSRALTNPVFSI